MSERHPKSLIVGTALLLFSGVWNLIPWSSVLSFGTAEKPPVFLDVALIVLGVVSLIAAYGVWNHRRWGMVLGLTATVLLTLSAIPPIGIAELPAGIRVMAGAGIILGLVIVVALLTPASRRAYVRG